MDLARDRLSTVVTIEMTMAQAVGAGAQDPHRRDGPTLPRGRRCRRHSPLRPGPPPAPPAPGVLNAQQQDALASPAPQLPQVRDDEGVKLPQLPGTCGGTARSRADAQPTQLWPRRHLGPQTTALLS